MAETGATPDGVLSFWFEDLKPENWFRQSDEVDAAIRKRFSNLHLELAREVPPIWRASAESRLALIIVYDQFSRNLYRGTPLAFATDPLALTEARAVLEDRLDLQVKKEWRAFFYMPFEHAENMADQDRAVALFEELGDEQYLDYAVRHRDVIEKFGRFPHRNDFLARESTPAEREYLSQPGAGF